MDDINFLAQNRAMVDDPRLIKELELFDKPSIYVGSKYYGNRGLGEAVTRIYAYNESGGLGWETWFAIYVGDEIVLRISARYVTTIWYVDGYIP